MFESCSIICDHEHQCNDHASCSTSCSGPKVVISETSGAKVKFKFNFNSSSIFINDQQCDNVDPFANCFKVTYSWISTYNLWPIVVYENFIFQFWNILKVKWQCMKIGIILSASTLVLFSLALSGFKTLDVLGVHLFDIEEVLRIFLEAASNQPSKLAPWPTSTSSRKRSTRSIWKLVKMWCAFITRRWPLSSLSVTQISQLAYGLAWKWKNW